MVTGHYNQEDRMVVLALRWWREASSVHRVCIQHMLVQLLSSACGTPAPAKLELFPALGQLPRGRCGGTWNTACWTSVPALLIQSTGTVHMIFEVSTYTVRRIGRPQKELWKELMLEQMTSHPKERSQSEAEPVSERFLSFPPS